MTTMRLDVVLPHHVGWVWMALANPLLRGRWFLAGGGPAEPGMRWRLRPDEALGVRVPIEVEVLEVRVPEELVMVWRADGVHVRVAWRLRPEGGGTALTFTLGGYIAEGAGVDRERFRERYARSLTGDLPRLLDSLPPGPPVRSRTVNQRVLRYLRRVARATGRVPVESPLSREETVQLTRRFPGTVHGVPVAPGHRRARRTAAIALGVLLALAIVAVCLLTITRPLGRHVPPPPVPVESPLASGASVVSG